MREGEEKESVEVVNETTFGGGGGARKYISIFEGSQAVPVRPSVEVMHMTGINFLHDAGRAAL
jgi:hypothetical protein